jgi:hypothetical protein
MNGIKLERVAPTQEQVAHQDIPYLLAYLLTYLLTLTIHPHWRLAHTRYTLFDVQEAG